MPDSGKSDNSKLDCSRSDLHDHVHKHSHAHTKAVLNRLSRAIGHLESVKRMVDDGRDCAEVLIQLAAVRSAIGSTAKLILKDHIEHCVVEAVEKNDVATLDELKKAIVMNWEEVIVEKLKFRLAVAIAAFEKEGDS